MKIVKVPEQKQWKIEINTNKVYELVITKSKKKMTATQKKYNTLTKRYLKEIEQQINMDSKNLYINDEFMAKKIKTTYSVAKKIKQNLQKEGLLNLVEKQNGPGKYPLWFFNFDYVVWTDITEAKQKRNRKSRYELYEQELLDIYAMVEMRVLDKFNDIELENSIEGIHNEIVITNIQYYMMIEKQVSSVLNSMGLTRADFKI